MSNSPGVGTPRWSRLRFRSWAVTAAFALLVVGCGGAASAPSNTTQQANLDPYAVGLESDLTGTNPEFGRSDVDGFNAYVDYINSHGGISGHPIKVVSRDDRLQAAQALQNFADLRDNSKASVVAGINFSNIAATLIPEAEKSQIPLIAQTPAQTVLNSPYGFGIQLQLPVLADAQVYFIGKRIKAGTTPKLAWVSSTSSAQAPAQTEGLAAAKARGWPVVAVENYPGSPVPTDLTPMASRIVQAGAEYVFGIPGQVTVQLWRALAQLGWKGTMLNDQLQETFLSQFNSPNYITVDSFHYADSPGTQLYVSQVKKVGGDPDGSETANGWTEAVLIAAAFSKCGFPCPGSKMQAALEGLTNVKDPGGIAYPGLGFSSTDHTASKTVGISDYNKGKPRTLETVKVTDLKKSA